MAICTKFACALGVLFSSIANSALFWLTPTNAFSPAVSIKSKVAKIFELFAKISGYLIEK
jgi:hypothetical protein